MIATLEWSTIGWTQLWQVTLLALIVGLLVRLAGRNRPHLAHVLWLVLFIKCVTPPLWSSPSGVFCWLQAMPASAVEGTVGHEMALPPSEQIVARPITPHSAALSEAIRSETATPVAIESPTHLSSASSLSLGDWALVVWMTGALLAAVLTVARWFVFIRRLRVAECGVSKELSEHVADLAKRLRVRTPVRVIVTRENIGPAVMGWRRPTILLPEVLAQRKSAAALEPIPAHELIHVRRGDLWWGLLQLVAQCLWWFHPLIAAANRRAYRTAEDCCDEATIAELGCKPGDYARALVEVIEHGLVLRSTPAMCGMRPADITSTRLERIMRLGPERQKRTPLWCWAVMLLSAAIALPGGAFLASADEPAATVKAVSTEASPPPEIAAQSLASERARQVATAKAGAAQKEPLVTLLYPVADMVVPVQDLTADAIDAGPVEADFDPVMDLITSTIAPFTWHDDASMRAIRSSLLLEITQSPQSHREISELLAQLRKTAHRQTALTVERVQMSETSYRRQFGWRFGHHPGLFPRPLGADDCANLHRDLASLENVTVKPLGRITLLFGQAGELPIALEDETPVLWLSPLTSEHLTRMFIAWTDDPRRRVTPFIDLKDGEAILMDVTNRRRRGRETPPSSIDDRASAGPHLPSETKVRTLLVMQVRNLVGQPLNPPD